MEPNVKVWCLLRMFQEKMGEPVDWGIGQIEQNLIIKKSKDQIIKLFLQIKIELKIYFSLSHLFSFSSGKFIY